jgi:hypothetical protein
VVLIIDIAIIVASAKITMAHSRSLAIVVIVVLIADVITSMHFLVEEHIDINDGRIVLKLVINDFNVGI